MATAVRITREEMAGTLRAERGWVTPDLPHGIREDVLDWKIPDSPVVLRVYTSIEKATGISRPVGGDAIRVCAIRHWPANDSWSGYIRTKRVHRVENWQKNLIKRLKDVYDAAKERLAKEPLPDPAPEALDKFEGVVGMLLAASDALAWPKITIKVADTTLRLSLVTKGQNLGSVNLTDGKSYEDSTWYGAIHEDGSLFRSQKWVPELDSILDELAEDPVKAVTEHGHKSGSCVFCSKELTDPRSLSAGYGKICAGNYSLPYPSKADVKGAA